MKQVNFQRFVISALTVQTPMITATFFFSTKLNSQNHAAQSSNPAKNIVSSEKNTFDEEIISNQIQILFTEILERELKNALSNIEPTVKPNYGSQSQALSYSPKPPKTDSQLQEQEKSATASYAIISQAILDSVWTKGDTQAISTFLPNLADSQRIELLEQFHGAVNRQELELEDMPAL